MPGVGRGMMRRTPGSALVQIIAIMGGGVWVQQILVRTRRRDAGVHGQHGVIVRLRFVTPSRVTGRSGGHHVFAALCSVDIPGGMDDHAALADRRRRDLRRRYRV